MSQSTHPASAPALGSRENFWGESDDTDESDHLDDCSYSELVDIASKRCDVENPTGTADELKALIRAAREDDEDEPEPCLSLQTIAEWKAHQLLRETAEKHSPIAKYAPPYVCPVSDEIEAARLSTLTAWLFGGDPDAVARSDRTAMHHTNCEVEMTDPEVVVPRVSEGERFGIREYGQHRLRSRYDPEHGYVTGPTLGDRPADEFLELIDIVLANAAVEHGFCEDKLEKWRRDAKRMKGHSDKSDEDVLATILEEMFEDTNDY